MRQLAAFMLLVSIALPGCGDSSAEPEAAPGPADTRGTTAVTTASTAPTTTAGAATTNASASTGQTATMTSTLGLPVELADTIATVRSGVVRIAVTSCDEGRVSGTGIVVSPRHIVTVEHVIDGASKITLERSRNILGNAEVIGLDRDRDLALLRLKKPITGHQFRFAKRAPR